MDTEEPRTEGVAGMAGDIWTGPTAERHGPPTPRRWRSAPAALLNLTGLVWGISTWGGGGTRWPSR